MDVAEQQTVAAMPTASQEQIDAAVASIRLETSYAGQFGHFIEPVSNRWGMTGKLV
jgi:ferrous iron transport protein B